VNPSAAAMYWNLYWPELPGIMTRNAGAFGQFAQRWDACRSKLSRTRHPRAISLMSVGSGH
jgi:hypothetical protein